ncbi:MAG: hypothetical protein KIC80_08625 [Brachyspira sp.]|nr:hypothetical protein [Brachyspira sp.]
MQINKITLINIHPVLKTQKNETTSVNNNPVQTSKLPVLTSAQYLAFTGGYSLDLASTIKNLDKLAQKKSNVYPPQIREWAGIILEEGNKAKETLIDIHKKFYESLKDCFTLEEAKKKFPEFKDVIPSSGVKFQDGSFLDDAANGRLEYFDTEEDLSLQLLKLYWAEGFSINDLRRYSGGKDISYAMKKLNIPLAEPTYGKILKLSDPEYNERLTREMTAKRMEALDRKAQEATGEPVYIKRGPLSEEHRRHISEGLNRYYENNPEAIYNLSERQCQFYIDNPEKAKILSRVTTKAWYIFGADRIKSAMSDYMKKNGIHTFNISKLEDPIKFTKEESKMMKKFWADNDWAKKSFSKNMSYAWKKVKEEQNIVYNIRVAPKNWITKMIEWGRKNGIELKEQDFTARFDPNNPDNSYKNPILSLYTRAFVDTLPGGSTMMANTYFLALLNVNRKISSMDLSKTDKKTRELCTIIKQTIKNNLFEHPDLPFEVNQFKVLDANEVQNIFGLLRLKCYEEFMPNLSAIFEKNMDKAYDYVSKNYKAGHPIKMNPYGIDL